jgi:dipeptidyl aminopeptidase/acylaminoacyl peptidase
MNQILRRLAGMALSLALLGGAAAAPPPPAESFFQKAAFHGAMLSPSGMHLAMVVGSKDARDRLAVLDLQTLKVQVVASFTDGDVFQYRWVNDKRLIFNVGDRKLALADRAFAGGLYAVNADGTGYRQLAQREHVWVQDNIGTRQLPWNTFPIDQDGAQDSDDIHVVRPEANDFASLLRLNTATGHADHIDSPLHANQWLLDAQGNVRAARSSQGQFSALHWRDPATGKWRKLREFDRFTGNDVSLLAVLPDGKLLVSARPGRNTDALYAYDPATDKLADTPLLGLQQFDVRPTELIHGQGKLLGVRFVTDAEVTHWSDEGMKAHQVAVDQLLPNTANMLSPPRRGTSPWLLVRAFSDVQPSLYYLFNTQTRKLSRVGSQMPGIQPAQMSAMDMVRYKARDGLEIPAYLTLPASAGGNKKNLPLIVYVHGGPWMRGATWQWQGDVQFLASRGYAVLQPEFRGSVGFGRKHYEASFKQWGLAMQDDLADGARWAIAQGLADPKRICIMGASYGGYATLMGLAKDGDLFACGVDWVGVSDILLMYDAHWSDFSDEWKRYGMPVMVGDRSKDAAQLEATSPIRLAARIKNPLLMAHGRIDRRVPIEHGRRMFDAVKGHNRQVEWVEYDKDGHGWSLPETDVDWWTRVEGFLARHIGRPQ